MDGRFLISAVRDDRINPNRINHTQPAVAIFRAAIEQAEECLLQSLGNRAGRALADRPAQARVEPWCTLFNSRNSIKWFQYDKVVLMWT